MSYSEIGLHAHHYSVTLDTFKNKKGLFKNMRITQEGGIKNGKNFKKFVNSMEGIKYPWYLIMYHPEY